MTRRLDELLDDALGDLERAVEIGTRVQRARQALGAIATRRRQRAGGLGEPIELEEVSPGVYQSAPRRTPAAELVEDLRRVRDALRPEVPEAIIKPDRRRRIRG